MGRGSSATEPATIAVAVDNNNNNSSSSGSNGSDAREESSRALFQGLFKDLGKQAMAMEAIMRVVCGKVDKLESWVTEMSYGMTELDLKLRNIAHNIEGTAANVDEAASVSRWAVPPEDDVAAMKKAATMVVKKVGPSNKQMRMSGMVAGILDRLTDVPATSESEHKPHKKKSKRPTTVEAPSIEPIEDSGDVMSGSEGVAVAVASKPRKTKKKKTSKSETEKEKEGVAVVVEDAPRVVVSEEATVEPAVEAERPAQAEEAAAATADQPEAEGEEIEDVKAVGVRENSEEQPTAMLEAVEERAELEEHSSENQRREVEIPEAEISDAVEETNDESQEQSEPDATVNAPLDGASFSAARSDASRNDTNEGEDELSEENSSEAVEQEKGEHVNDEVVELRDEGLEPTVKCEGEPIETKESQNSSHDTMENVLKQELTTSAPHRDSKEESSEVPIEARVLMPPETTVDPLKETIAIRQHEQVEKVEHSPTSADSREPTSEVVSTDLTIDRQQEEPPAALLTIGTPPQDPVFLPVDASATAEEREASNEPLQVPEAPSIQTEALESARPAANASDETQTLTASPSSAQAPIVTSPPLPTSNDESDRTESKPVSSPLSTNDIAAARALRRQSTRRARKEAADASKQGSGRRVSSRGQKATALPKGSVAPAVAAVAPVASPPSSSVQKNETSTKSEAQASPTTTPKEVASPLNATKVNTSELPKESGASNVNEAAEDGEEDEESDSFSNNSDSEDNSDESDSDQSIVDLSGSVKGAALLQGGGAEGAVAASRLTRTLTALNKLKKANMLSPEEAEELRKRAHGKWFKLRDHIKEKQKKDMANIMLKRKKNIFTVSNRIELLEEKSRVRPTLSQCNAI
ncbi:hypothetical protein PINS_up008694 [Pythium insidiosum]|nr:hypothetical protein PINS_up008694 [Pythium insidiosum]